VKVAAGVLRVAAVSPFLLALIGVLGTCYGTRPEFPFAVTPVAVVPGVAILALLISVVTSIVLWGFADALILLADTYDNQQRTQDQLAALMRDRTEAPAGSPPATS
jgi:hypothetical protein